MSSTPRSFRFAVAGRPVAHSASPAVYRAAFAALGLDAFFGLLEIGDAHAGFESARDDGYGGLAVTIPHKGAALHFADRADEISRLVGAANTLIFGERTEAANTDVHGILTAFERSGVALAGLRLCVLGAGGAARAAVAAAHLGGASSVIVLARTLDRGRRLAEEFRGRTGLSIEARPYEGGSTAVADADGVINTTPLGLRGDDPLPLPSEALRRDLVVFDAIYRPARTTWLEAAQNAGAVAIPGTRMFLAQAAEQFRLLTGRAAPEDVMAKALTEIPGCDWL